MQEAVFCPTCGIEVDPERVELGYRYCMRKQCVRENRVPLQIVEIAQTKTNATYKIFDEKTAREMSEGKFRRDPVVVKRETLNNHEPLPQNFKPKKIVKYAVNRVKLVQSLHDQGFGVEEILEKTAHLRMTRSEVVKYMLGKR